MSCCCRRQKNKVQILEGIFEPRYDNTPGKTKTKQNNTKNNRRESIYPKSKRDEIINNKKHIEEERQKRETFTDNFLGEIIQCGSCQEKIALKERKQLHNCSSCDKFFCCNFAGACVGEECSIQYEGKKQSLSYCMNCVNPYLKINTQDNDQCICKKCENMPDILNHYKEV